MASLEIQGDGWYRVVFRYGGQKYQRALDTQDEKAAKHAKARIEENLDLLRRGRLEYNRGDDLVTRLLSDGKLGAEPVVTERLTLDDFLTRYKKDRPPGKEASTSYTEGIHVCHLLRILGKKTPLADVTPAALQRYINARSQDNGRRGGRVSHVTVKKELATLTAIWNRWGVMQGFVTAPLSIRNLAYPKHKEKPPFQTWEQIERKSKGDPKSELWDSLFLSIEQIKELLDYVETHALHPFLYPMFVAACHTGARRSELMRSQPEDFDFAAGLVTIREKKKDRRKDLTFRYVPMSPLLKNVMRAWLKEHRGDVTFCREPGKPLSAQLANHHLRWTLDGSKWSVIRGWHTLRHSFLSNLAARGVAESVIQDLAGHLNALTTKRYIHLFPSTREAAIKLAFG